MNEENEIEFLQQSNWIEGEYGERELEDAVVAWNYGKDHKENINMNVILEIHRLLLQRRAPAIAGKIRERAVYIGGDIKDQAKSEIEEELHYWCHLDIGFIVDLGNDPVEEIKMHHIMFESIHPFEDGNGRVGRMLLNMERLAVGLPLLIIHEGKEQQEYYKWFKDPKYINQTT